jgi:hypothetical protein
VTTQNTILEKLSGKTRNNRKMFLQALQQDGLILVHASDGLRNDREVVLTTIRQNRLALKYASTELQADPELIQIASATQETF